MRDRYLRNRKYRAQRQFRWIGSRVFVSKRVGIVARSRSGHILRRR